MGTTVYQDAMIEVTVQTPFKVDESGQTHSVYEGTFTIKSLLKAGGPSLTQVQVGLNINNNSKTWGAIIVANSQGNGFVPADEDPTQHVYNLNSLNPGDVDTQPFYIKVSHRSGIRGEDFKVTYALNPSFVVNYVTNPIDGGDTVVHPGT